MIKGITHVAVRVTDIDRSLHFYTQLLGIPEKFRLTKEEHGIRLIYLQVADHQFIELFPGAEGTYTPGPTPAYVHICLEVDDIHETYSDLTSKGVATRGEPVLGADGSWQFWIADPDGNQIEFHQYTADSRQITG